MSIAMLVSLDTANPNQTTTRAGAITTKARLSTTHAMVGYQMHNTQQVTSGLILAGASQGVGHAIGALAPFLTSFAIFANGFTGANVSQELEEKRLEAQRKLAELNRKHDLKMLSTRHELEKQLAFLNHQMLLERAAYERETFFRSAEFQSMLANSWPLIPRPFELISSPNPSGLVPLKVLLSPPKLDYDRNELPYPFPNLQGFLERDLKLFLESYYPQSDLGKPGIRPVKFLDAAWDTKRIRGGSAINTLHRGLQSEAILVLELNVVEQYLDFHIGFWETGHQGEPFYKTLIPGVLHRDIIFGSARANGHMDSDGKLTPNDRDYEALAQLITPWLCLITGWVADVHHLIHHDVPPLLPKLIPDLVMNELNLQVVKFVVEGYNQIYQVLEEKRPYSTPQLALDLALSLAYLSDKSWAKEQLTHSLQLWLRLRQVRKPEKANPIEYALETMESALAVSALTKEDWEYVEKLKECFAALGDNQGITQAQKLLNASEDLKEKEKVSLVQTLIQDLEQLKECLAAFGNDQLTTQGQKLVDTLATINTKEEVSYISSLVEYVKQLKEFLAAFGNKQLTNQEQKLLNASSIKEKVVLINSLIEDVEWRKDIFGLEDEVPWLNILLKLLNVLKVIPEHSEKLEQFFISFGHDKQATQEVQELQNALKDALEDLEHKLEEGKDIYERKLENVSLVHTLTEHSGFVSSVAISPDGQTMVSGSCDDTIKIWCLSTGTLLDCLTKHSDGVNTVAISPDGKTLVSGSDDNTIKIWSLSTGKLLRTLTEHSNSVMTVAISPDGQTLVSGSYDNTIKIWSLSTGKLLRTLTGHSDWVRCVAISPDGQTLVSGSDDRTIKIWSLSTGKLLRTLTEEHSCFVYSVAISPDGRTLASNGNYDDSITIWRLSTGKLLRCLTDGVGVSTVAISPDGKTLVSGSCDGTIKIWSLSTGKLLRTL
ncbi:WD40 repeat domain-containing protein, partial [Fischerella thermalis]|uniref:WD40 repeat domain-containing protein n=2 Tax=Fischerella thermalis TaxID=372787 RepID=UPI001F41A473